MNDMLKTINQQYQNHNFEELQNFYRRFAYSLDLTEVEEKIEKNMQKINTEKEKCYVDKWEIKNINKIMISHKTGTKFRFFCL